MNEGRDAMHKRLAILSQEHREHGSMGKRGVEGESMNIGYNIPKNAVSNTFVAMALGKGGGDGTT